MVQKLKKDAHIHLLPSWIIRLLTSPIKGTLECGQSPNHPQALFSDICLVSNNWKVYDGTYKADFILEPEKTAKPFEKHFSHVNLSVITSKEKLSTSGY